MVQTKHGRRTLFSRQRAEEDVVIVLRAGGPAGGCARVPHIKQIGRDHDQVLLSPLLIRKY